MVHLPVMAKLLCLHYWLSYIIYCKKAVLKLKYYAHEFPVLTGIINSFAYSFNKNDLGKVAGFLVQTLAMMKY